MRLMFSVAWAAAGWVALAPLAAGAAEPGFVPLFDGHSLDGWQIKCKPADRPAAEGFWKVEEGAIVADSLGHKGHDYVWLVTKREFGDFVLRLRFQVERGLKGNSGIQIRSRYDEQAGYLDGPQIDIHPPGPWRTGMVWDETRGVQRWLYPEVPKGQWVDPSMTVKGFKFFYADEGDGWNDLEITAEGTRLRAVLNGVTVMELDGRGVLDDAVHRQRKVGLRGHIALQIHKGDEVNIRFKDIRVKPL